MPSLRKAIDLIGTGQTLGGWLTPVPGVVAIVTFVMAFLEKAQWSHIIFLASGVLCFLTASIHYTSSWLRDNSVKGKVRLEQLNVAQLWKKSPTDNGFTMNCVFVIKNHSTFDLYYRLDDALFILQGKTAVEKNINKQIIILPQGATGVIQVPTISGINIKEPSTGDAVLKISFGKAEKYLSHSYEIDGMPNVVFGIDDKGNVVNAVANIFFRSVTYT